MPSFTAKDVQALRQATGAGMMDAKRAMDATDGNADEAAKWLREQGLGGVAKRADREAGEGLVARSPRPTVPEPSSSCAARPTSSPSRPSSSGVADELAGLVAANGEQAIGERDAELDNLRTTLKENISVGRVVRMEIGDSSILGSYLHIQNQRGVNAVLVELHGGDAELAHDIALHISFAKPKYISDAKTCRRPTSQRSGRRSSRSRATRASPKRRSRRSSRGE